MVRPCGLRLVEVQVLSSALCSDRRRCAFRESSLRSSRRRARTDGGQTHRDRAARFPRRPARTAARRPTRPTPAATDSSSGRCNSRRAIWSKITWGATDAVDQLALFAPATTDAADGSSLHLQQPAGRIGTTPRPACQQQHAATSAHLAHDRERATGAYPLVFVNSTRVNAGPYCFTAVVLHAASVAFQHQISASRRRARSWRR